MYDVVIVGGGPAGAMLARRLGGQYRVLLVERRRLDLPAESVGRDKCCGGLLAPQAQQVLAEEGLVLPRAVLTTPQPAVVQAIDADAGLTRTFPKHYLNCHRGRLDRWLLSLAPAGVTVRCGEMVRGVEEDAAGVTVRLRHDTVRARLVVGADGAASLVRAHACPGRPAPPTYLAVQQWHACAAPPAAYTALFDRALTDFYGWAIPKEGALVVGVALAPRAAVHAHFARFLARLQACGLPLGPALLREGALVSRPTAPGQICLGTDRVLLVGEAAGWISPSSAEGFSYAFRSALALAKALEKGLEGALPRYRQAAAPLMGCLLRSLCKSPAMSTPWLRGLALRLAPGALPAPQAAPAPAWPVAYLGRGESA